MTARDAGPGSPGWVGPTARRRLVLIDVAGLGARLAQSRATAALGVSELAEAAEIDPGTVIAIEAGALTPSAGTVQRLADSCGCSPVSLLFPTLDGALDAAADMVDARRIA